MEWISVRDELPGNEEKVLVCDEDSNMVVGCYGSTRNGPCWRIGNDEVSWDFDYNLDYNVTHWMKLPEPPKELT